MARSWWMTVVVSALLAGCSPEPRAPAPARVDVSKSWVMLVPDWQNHVVHRISADGTYQGDFLDSVRIKSADSNPRGWRSPRAILFVPGVPDSFWLAAERGLSVWGAAGNHLRTITTDTTHLQDPVAMLRFGDEVFVLSEDKKKFLVFDLEGVQTRTFGFPELDRATDCKAGPDGLLYVTSSLKNSDQAGLVSVWDPTKTTDDGVRPLRYLIAPDPHDGGTASLQSLVFDDAGDLIVTDLFSGRVERWSVQTNSKLDVILDGGKPGVFKELERGPDGLVYLAGPAGIYRFAPDAEGKDLTALPLYFDAAELAGRFSKPFSPQAMTFVPASLLGAPRLAD
jgi:hypothetical protein